MAPEADDHDDVTRLVAGLKRRLGIEDPAPPVQAPVEAPRPVEEPPVEAPAREPHREPPTVEPAEPRPPPSIADRLDRSWGIYLEAGFGSTYESTYDERRIVNSIERTVTVTDTDDLEDAFGAAVTWDHPVGLGGLRVGARVGFQASAFNDDAVTIDVNLTTVDAWVRYVQPVRAVGLYGAVGGGFASLVVDGDLDGDAVGSHVVVAGGVLVPVGPLALDVAIGWDAAFPADYDVTASVVNPSTGQIIKASLDQRDPVLARPHVRVGVQF